MSHSSPEVVAAKQLAGRTADILGLSPAYRRLDPATQSALRDDLAHIRRALEADPANYGQAARDPYALALESPTEAMRRRQGMSQLGGNGEAAQPAAQPQPAQGPRAAATETLAARAGALSDEIDFPGFVASLVHGTFDALIDASIRQMEAYADLVSAVAKDVDRFTSENVTTNQVRDYLLEKYPHDLQRTIENGQPRLRPRPTGNDEPRSPDWLQEYGLEGQELTEELVEEEIIPTARRQVGEQRLQLLATMVLLGMNRIVVQDGSISAKVRFRAMARDRAAVDYAQSFDPTTWGNRGTAPGSQATMMVSTVGANVQADTDLRAELFGEVRINFASETLPLDRFADAAQVLLLQRNARTPAAPATPPPQPALPAPAAPPAVLPPAAAPGTGSQV